MPSLGSNLLRPVELGSIDPHAMQNDRELTCDRYFGLAEPVSLGELHPPGLHGGPFRHARQQNPGGFKQITAQHGVAALRDSSGPIDLSGRMASTGQPDVSTYAPRPRKPCWIVNRCLEGERGDRTDARYGHKPADLSIMTRQSHNLAVKFTDLLPDGIARFEQRSDRSYQLRTALDQLLGPHGKDIELGAADDEAEVLQKAANMVLEIALDLDQQRPAGQQRPDRVAVDILDVHLFEPAGLHDTGDPDGIVAVALVDLHLEHGLGVPRVDTDHR